jgi:arylsulfatase A-like enzyme
MGRLDYGDHRPNIIFFFTDDQRFDTLRTLGNGEILTPHMDALVRSGTAFTNAYIMGGSCPAVCMPSRAMLMTGRTLFHLSGEGQTIPAGHTMLGEALQAAGYRSFGVGKWHNGPEAYARSFSAGAEIFFGGMDDHWNVPACDFDPTGRYDLLSPVVRDPHTSNAVSYRLCDHIVPGKHSSELFADAAIEFLEGYRGQDPFFMYLSFMAPHDPRTMPRQYLDAYAYEGVSLPPSYMPEHPFDNGELTVRDEQLAAWPRTPEEIRRHTVEYYAMITHLDAEIGRVLETLERTGRSDNTIIILAGDNGLAIGRHGLMGKQNLYDHSLHVPLIMRGPGIPRGEQREVLCYLLDIYPTICDLVGIPIPDSVEGRSLLPAIRDASCVVRDALWFAYRDVQRSVQDNRYKLIEYVVDGHRTTQLFDLGADRWELDNVAGRPGSEEPLRHLRRQLVRWRDELDDPADPFWAAYGEEAWI